MKPAVNWRMIAVSTLVTSPLPFTSAPPGQANEGNRPAINCDTNRASMLVTLPSQLTSPDSLDGVGVFVGGTGVGVFVGGAAVVAVAVGGTTGEGAVGVAVAASVAVAVGVNVGVGPNVGVGGSVAEISSL